MIPMNRTPPEILPGNTYCGATDWGDCKKCRLYHTRNRVAIKRYSGSGHTKILFIGEAAGELENKTGIPFVGTAGKILEQLLKLTHFQFQYCITNTVGCRPVDVLFLDSAKDEELDDVDSFSLSNYMLDQDYEIQNWNREPTKAEIELCKPHIDELMESFRPHGVVYLGKVAESYTNPKYLIPTEKLVSDPESKLFRHSSYNNDWSWRHIPTLSMLHPAYIARMEYKLLTVRKEAHKLDLFVERFIG